MRILHTSDWHLGQHFMGKTRQAEHLAFLQWLIEQVEAHSVDAVIVAGDVFDTGAPPSYARELYNHFVVALYNTGAQLVVLGGNHDSVATLGESKTLLACLNTHVIACAGSDPDPQLLCLPRRDGAPGALVCAIPFIRPRDVMQSQSGQSAEDKQQSLQQAIHRHYQDLFDRAVAMRAGLGGRLPIIATGHLTTVGASASDSVREIYVGSLEAFPTNAFPPADYIALGHIHRPQKVGGQNRIRYSGSPLPLSFDELGAGKEVLLVELGDDGLRSVTPLAVPCFQPLLSLRGTLQELGVSIAQSAQQGTGACPVWLDVLVRGDDYLSDLQSRIQGMTAGLPVEVLRVRRDRNGANAVMANPARETLDELTPHDVFARRLQAEDLSDALKSQLESRYQGIVTALQQEAEA